MGACVVAGCGKSEGGDAPPVARADFAPQAAQIFCESFAGCCNQQNVPVDTKACSDQLASRFDMEWADLDAGTAYSADAAGECLAALRKGIRCGSPNDDAIEAACEKVFVGKIKPGQPCTESAQCEKPATGSVYCDQSGQVEANPDQGLCTVEQTTPGVHAKLGEACLSTCDGSDCNSIPAPAPGVGDPAPQPAPTAFCYRQDGLYCAVGGTCAQLVQLGGACQYDGDCAGTTFCGFDTHVCSAQRPNGGACESDRHCQSGDCQGVVCGEPTISVDACMSGSPLR